MITFSHFTFQVKHENYPRPKETLSMAMTVVVEEPTRKHTRRRNLPNGGTLVLTYLPATNAAQSETP